jgi:hypothetical protein
MTAKSRMIAALTALSIAALPAAPALAWGDKEQGFVAGVAAAVIVDQILTHNRRARAAYGAPVQYYVDPRASSPSTYSSVYSTPAARAFQSSSVSERKAIQSRLRAYGYYRGGIDATFGPGTYSAITAYAKDQGRSGNLSSTSGAYAIYDGLIY